MYVGHDNLYRDATLFDQAFAAAAQRLQAWLPADSEQRWQLAFRVLGAMFALLAVMVLFRGMQDASGGGAQLVVALAATGLMATTQFLLTQARPAQPRTARTKKPAQTRVAQPVEEPVEAEAQATTEAASVSDGATRPQDFLRMVKEAGVNVRIAKALYTAGIRTPEAVCRQSDEALLAIPGVGPATLKKLRQTFC